MNSWPENINESCELSASALGVSPRVHDEDFIFRFLIENPVFKQKSGAVNYYFNDGKNSAKKVRKNFDQWVESEESKLQILEFASGFGAVTRHLNSQFEGHDLQSCDIHTEAVKFISTTLGVTAIQSSEVPENLKLPNQYDMIFVLSFFSHMPKTTWSRWLLKLYQGLNEGGVLLFTTHGRKSMQYFPQAKLDFEGYWFERNSEQKDLSADTYGQTITTKEFVEARIQEIQGAKILSYEEAGWWEHQDLFVIQKCSGSED